ncbi:MAG: hypothetical protein DHS20C17_21840 [Cyclobacteriaceae bacterium]|nr:MAG: hypothetical protein DHS20C17_21840 [Cyclobacteriaceae bacterium]
MIFTFSLQAQDAQKFIVHEDVVFPSKIAAYEAASKVFAETMEKHEATDAAFLTVSLDDNRYLYVSAIADFAALDSNPFKKVSEAMGEDAFGKMMSQYDGTFESHKNYVINLSHDLSYNSNEIIMEGVNFRHFDYWYVTPGKWKEAKAIAKEWKDLYASKGVEQGYRVYTGGLGTEELLMVVSWAKSPEEFYSQRAKNREALGDINDIMNRTMALTRKRESFDGMIRPELSYQPKSAMAEN